MEIISIDGYNSVIFFTLSRLESSPESESSRKSFKLANRVESLRLESTIPPNSCDWHVAVYYLLFMAFLCSIYVVYQQSFQVEAPQNMEISLFIEHTIGRFFTGTFQSGKTARNSCYQFTIIY